MSTCPACRAEQPDGILCRQCRVKTAAALDELPALHRALVETLTRQDNVAPKADGAHHAFAQPLAFNANASALATDLRAQLVGWVKVTIEDMHAACPDDTIPAMVMHLRHWLTAFAKHEAAAEFAAEVQAMPPAIRRAIDKPDRRIRITACVQVYVGERCPGTISAHLRESVSLLRCDTCGQEWEKDRWELVREGVMDDMRMDAARNLLSQIVAPLAHLTKLG